MHLDPALPRFQIEQTINGTQITIAAQRNLLVLAFLSVWLCGWLFGEITVASQLINADSATGPDLFNLIWLIGWTLGGAFALTTVLWQLCGKESVTISSDALLYRVHLLGIGRNRSYAMNHINGLRAVAYETSIFSNQAAMKPPFIGATTGPIAFDYGAQTMRILPSMNEGEARILIGKLKERIAARVFQ